MDIITTSGHAPVNGLSIYYEIHGEGDMPLVLIHGGGSTIETSFSTILPMLAAHRKVIAVELQAHGRTSDRDAPESFEQDADDVAGLIKYLKIDKADFLGFSNGGTTATQLAIRHPDIVRKIIAVSPTYKREGLIEGFFEGMKHATLKDMPELLQDAFLKVTPDRDLLQNMFNKDRERMINFKDIPDDILRSVKAATLLMVADHDVTTIEHIVATSRLIPGAQLIVLPGGHGAIVGEVGTVKQGSKLPEISVALIEEFLNE